MASRMVSIVQMTQIAINANRHFFANVEWIAMSENSLVKDRAILNGGRNIPRSNRIYPPGKD